MKGKLKIGELTFSAAHYLKGHPKCQALHGHTYFVRDIEILYELPGSEFLDFATIEAVINYFDHKLLVPLEDSSYWLSLAAPCKLDYVAMPNTTSESLAEDIINRIKSIPGVKFVSLSVFEGPNQGAKYSTEVRHNVKSS